MMWFNYEVRFGEQEQVEVVQLLSLPKGTSTINQMYMWVFQLEILI